MYELQLKNFLSALHAADLQHATLVILQRRWRSD